MNQPNYTPQEARAALRYMDIKQTDLAVELEVSPQAIQFAIKNPSQSNRLAERIAEIVTAYHLAFFSGRLRRTG